MTREELLKEARQLIIDYYNVVDIKKTKGFTARVDRKGNIVGKDVNYEYPAEALDIQRKMLINGNKLIQAHLMNQHNRWLMGYEHKLLYADQK